VLTGALRLVSFCTTAAPGRTEGEARGWRAEDTADGDHSSTGPYERSRRGGRGEQPSPAEARPP